MRMTPLRIVDGSTPGPDGQPVDRFARFADRVIKGGTLDDDFPPVDERPTWAQRVRIWWRRLWHS